MNNDKMATYTHSYFILYQLDHHHHLQWLQCGSKIYKFVMLNVKVTAAFKFDA